MKRVSPIAVVIGAFPGALPTLIGAVAVEGELTMLGLVLFAIQFFWQFPHFWSIGWLGYEDYNKWCGFSGDRSIFKYCLCSGKLEFLSKK